ncbi:MAG: thiamine diphosphokinase [Syntrophomonadaceae bacterium]|nr:thiamine diphosphokinase [Syntrophomonadaceae bacterium]
MKCLILANGSYGPLESYQHQLTADIVLCADGGANYAYLMELIPDYIIGDMDSISSEVKDFYLQKQVVFKKFPRQKDFTDTQLVISFAEELGATEIVFLGTLGNRLDHTLSNLYSSMDACKKGKKVLHYSPELTIYIVSDKLNLQGKIGDLVSVLALTDDVDGLTERGFKYPLEKVRLEKTNPYAISNYLITENAEIELDNGIIAVFHYHNSSNEI